LDGLDVGLDGLDVDGEQRNKNQASNDVDNRKRSPAYQAL
jgi:hypothetical protein